ncbi:MAG: rod shape-determining protein MreC [Deinococcaceae bacterium]
MVNFSRATWVFIGLMWLSVFALRFWAPPPPALSSGLVPLTHLGSQLALTLRQSVGSVLLDRDLGRRYVALKEQYSQLKTQHAQLQDEVATLRDAVKIANVHPRERIAMAPVIDMGLGPELSFRLTIGSGSDQGVVPFMPVVTSEGLVGQVVSVGRNRSVVLTLVDPSSRVGIVVGASRIQAVARGVYAGRLRAELPKTNLVQVGDSVVTSSWSGVFPVGVPVGRVEQVLPSSFGIHQVVLIRPEADFSSLSRVGLLPSRQ